MNPRQLALDTLIKVIQDTSYSNIAVQHALKDEKLKPVDKGFYTALVYGVLERKITLDYQLSLYLKKPLKKLHPTVYTILLLGAYQILYMEKVPIHAAVNESVKLSKKNKVGFASGMINAVLRKIEKNGIKYPESKNMEFNYSVIYSCPGPLVNLFIKSYGLEDALKIMESGLKVPPVSVRVNTVKTDTESLMKTLSLEGVEAKKHDVIEDALILKDTGSVTELESFKKGLFHVQDISSQFCCAALDPKPGETIVDVCAAPGGKTFTIAERMEGKGTVYSFDLYDQRVKLINDGAKRLGLANVKACVQDASKEEETSIVADRVLCDVPCSGLGIIGRKPEIRFKDFSEIDNLPDLQYAILCNSIRYLRNDGILVYSTCTLNPKENIEVCERFVREHPSFEIKESRTLLPHKDNCDGFFVAVLLGK